MATSGAITEAVTKLADGTGGELISTDHEYRVIDPFVGTLAMAELGFERTTAADTGRPGYDPRDLLKLYLTKLLYHR